MQHCTFCCLYCHCLADVFSEKFSGELFNSFQLPDLVGPSRPLYELLHNVHELLGWALCAIATLHILAALKRHFILKDDVLRRMMLFTRAQKPRDRRG